MNNKIILEYSLLLGAGYFFAISLAHLTGVKIPGLFIYYNIPSYPYQDQIISFLTFGWACFFYSAAKNRVVVPSVLLSCFIAILGLLYINLFNDFDSLIEGASSTPFWIQTILLFFYLVWLVVFYIQSNRTN